MASAALLAAGAAGGAVLLVTLADLFVTIFNYDGFTFLAGRMQRATWRALSGVAALLPDRARTGVLSLGSAALLPLTLVWWLALEVVGFALVYWPGLDGDAFVRTHAGTSFGVALYYSGGAISSLTFGDVVPRTGLFRALTDLETVIGLATFTLGLTYVIAAFDALGTLHTLHGRVRRHAVAPHDPASIVARYYHGGQPSELSGLLAALTDDLDAYDQGLRRYPVVFYFHARRIDRSIPVVFGALGELVELLQWGLPESDPITTEPYLLALADQHRVTLGRLQRSFVGPENDPPVEPETIDEFTRKYASGTGDPGAFRELRDRAARAAGHTDEPDRRYERYCEWLPFHRRSAVLLDRVRAELGYGDLAQSVVSRVTNR